MVVRIIIAGMTQCQLFAEVCMVADYLSQNLPSLQFERIEKPVLDWEEWLFKVNQKNKWHHRTSPIVWKEALLNGSKAYYIGDASSFLEYCYSYYNFDSFLASEKFNRLPEILSAYHLKVVNERTVVKRKLTRLGICEKPPQLEFIVCISGAGHPLTTHLISGLLDMSIGKKSISRIYAFDCSCSKEFMEYVERECIYVGTDHSVRIVKRIERIGSALAKSDLLIVMDHAPFQKILSIGDWLDANKEIMTNLSMMINASAIRTMNILFPNLGPACYNATTLAQLINITKTHVVVATSDLGIEITPTLSEIAEVPLKNIYCPPVWGFVGINHLVDVNTTVHRYDSFEPYNRYLKVKNSTLVIGSLTPEVRIMEYLMYFDESLWKRVTENQAKFSKSPQDIKKVVAVLDVVKLWFCEPNPDHIICLGVRCNGTFGLTFKGNFSQPCRLVDREWVPAGDYPLPKDKQIKIKYLQEMAEYTMTLEKGALPKLKPYCPCSCIRRYRQK